MSADSLHPSLVVPYDRLPPGFAARLEHPPEPPVEPKPASTVVLLRDTQRGPETLLLRRHRSSGFVPGAYVFPGGRVDRDDVRAGYWRGRSRPRVPAPAFWVAAVRELFEETGVLLARNSSGPAVPDAAQALAAARLELLEDGSDAGAASTSARRPGGKGRGRVTLLDVLRELRLRLDVEGMVHVAQWITPVVEARRYDTHFFLAGLPAGGVVAADPREMTDAVWLTPAAALERFAAGALPMVFPTIKLLERIAPFPDVRAALDTLRGRRVRTIMPRLVRTREGIGFVIENEEPEDG